MKWYHYTGMPCFRTILQDESLLSAYEKIRNKFKDRPDKMKKLEEIWREHDINVDPRSYCVSEYTRRNNIFLTPNKQEIGGLRDILLEFELDKAPNNGRFFISPEVSLDYLVGIEAKEKVLPGVTRILEETHNGKYKKFLKLNK